MFLFSYIDTVKNVLAENCNPFLEKNLFKIARSDFPTNSLVRSITHLCLSVLQKKHLSRFSTDLYILVMVALMQGTGLIEKHTYFLCFIHPWKSLTCL